MRRICLLGMALLASLLFGLAPACSKSRERSVVIYTSFDEMYSRPILEDFERRTGIRVLPVYDTEVSKTTGLVTRLIAEHGRPRADVFWNAEVAQTIVLKSKGILAAYRSPSAEAIPPEHKDPDAFWTGFAARARVLIYNSDLVKAPPKSIQDLARPEWAGKAAIAHPLFGTTATQAAALFALWGDEKAKTFLHQLRENRVAVLPGNADVRDLVASGEYAIGLTDTDDANGGVEDGLPVRWLFPDQEEGGIGTLVVPNTVALIQGGPNPNEGRALIDYLLSPEVEARLAQSRTMQVPLNPSVARAGKTPRLVEIRAMKPTPAEIAAKMEATAAFVEKEFVQ